MKTIYIVMKKATEYNDEYDVPQEGGEIYKAFRDRKNAEAALPAAKLEAIEGKQAGYGDSWPSDMSYIEEVQVADDDVIGYSASLAKAKLAREAASRLAKDALTKQAEKIFKNYSSLVGFRWTQYTPYFNDGDECTFRVNDYPCMKFIGMDDYADAYEAKNVVAESSDTMAVLYFREGDSDKVYQISIEAIRGGFSVMTTYGRRGSNLQFSQKTEKPVAKEKAKEIFESLVKEKVGKGYKASAGNPADEAEEAIKAMLVEIDEDDMKELFGDHVQITATRDGFEVEEYEHD